MTVRLQKAKCTGAAAAVRLKSVRHKRRWFMSKFLFVIAFALLLAPQVYAEDQPASAASAKELVSLMDGRKAFDGAFGQMDHLMDMTMKQASEGRQLTPEQQKIVDDMRAKMVALVKDSMNWDAFEPKMEEIYRKSFSQSEMDGMIRFYRSPAGRAVIAKMPVVMQNTMQVMQEMMADLMPKVQELAKDTASQLQNLNKQAPDDQSSDSQASAGQ
ncbi:MAG TPA: DUF2059 domain-containing protein [Steroidobacteraceae bacterium]|nr:DUF2059 domain-containing protein [Steroidobacteraceae bacterium]